MARNQLNQHDLSETNSYLDSNIARNTNSSQIGGIISDYRNSISSPNQKSHQPTTLQGATSQIIGQNQPPQSNNFSNCNPSQGQTNNGQCLSKSGQQQPNFFGMSGNGSYIDQQNQIYGTTATNNNYGSDGIGVYEMHQIDEMGNMLQLCSPNPHAGISQSLTFQNFSSGSNFQTTASNSLLNPSIIKQQNEVKNQSFGIQQNFNNNQSRGTTGDIFIRENPNNQYLQIDHNQFSVNNNLDIQDNYNVNQYNNQKLPCFNEIQQQASRQKDYRGGNSGSLSIFNQGQSKQHNSPYFGSQINQPTLPSPSSVARIDLIMCHGQQEQLMHEQHEKSNTNSQMAFSNNVGSMNLSTQGHSSNTNNIQRDSLFSDKQNATQISPISQNIQQQASSQQQQLVMTDNDDQDQKNITPILFTPNNKDKIGHTAQMENSNNLYSKDLFEHVTKSREQHKQSQQVLKRQDSEPRIEKRTFAQRLKYDRIMTNLDLDFKDNTNQHSNGSHLDINETFHKNNGSFSKFDYSPQFQSFHIMNNPLSPSEYTHGGNFHFNEDHHHFLRVNGQLPAKKQRSSNSQFDLTFSKQESVDQVSFGNMMSNHNNHKHNGPGNNSMKLEQNNLEINSNNGQRQSVGSYQFCQQCHQENLRRLLDDEQKKLKELEVIKMEKAQILNNVAKYRQEQQDNFMLFFCDRVEGSMTRKIGRLTLQERYIKIKRFKEKKQSRIWKKKISYDCRKQVADKRLRIKGRFIRKDDQKKLLQEIFGNGELFPEDIKQFNSGLTQLMSEYQKQKMQKNQLGPKDFLIHKKDEKGIRHSFFDFKKFSNFIEEEEEDDSIDQKALNNSQNSGNLQHQTKHIVKFEGQKTTKTLNNESSNSKYKSQQQDFQISISKNVSNPKSKQLLQSSSQQLQRIEEEKDDGGIGISDEFTNTCSFSNQNSSATSMGQIIPSSVIQKQLQNQKNQSLQHQYPRSCKRDVKYQQKKDSKK